jgi:hypothetical protein
MDDAEHSARLERVMAGHESASQTRHETADVIVQETPISRRARSTCRSTL